MNRKLLFLASILLIPAMFIAFWPSSFVDQSENLSIENIPGINPQSLAQQNITYRLNGPVTYYRSEGIALFEVEIIASGFSEKNLIFTGDGQRFNGFVAELNFVTKNAGSFHVGQAGAGAAEGIASLITGFWDVICHPVSTAVGLSHGAADLTGYLYNASIGKADPVGDIINLSNSIYINTASEIADEANFSYQEIVTEEGRKTVHAMTNWKLSGRGAMELALLLAPLSKINLLKTTAEISEIARAGSTVTKAEKFSEVAKGYESILKGGALFSASNKIAISLRRMARFSVAERKLSEQIIRPLTNPKNLSSLGVRKANPRVHKLLYHLYDLEKNGGDVAYALNKGLMPGTIDGLSYNHQLVERQILANYRQAKEWGLFENPANLDKMKSGCAPVIMRGPNTGKVVHVDHIISLKQAPDLGNNFANLRYLSETENWSKGAAIDSDALHLMQEMRSAGLSSSPSLQILSTAK